MVNREEFIQLSDTNDINIINNLVEKMIELTNKSNMESWVEETINAEFHFSPIDLFESNEIFQTNKQISDALINVICYQNILIAMKPYYG